MKYGCVLTRSWLNTSSCFRGLFKVLVAIFFFSPVISSATASPAHPFDPVFAADQEIITSRSIEFEGLQFDRIGDWLISRDNVETKRLEKQQAEELMERHRALHEKGVVSEDQLRSTALQLQQAEMAFQIAVAEQGLQRARGLKFKYLLLDEGSPQSDFRKDVAQSLKDIHQQERVILTSQLSGARARVTFWARRVEIDRHRFEKRLIKKSELERSELIYKKSQDQRDTIEHKLTTNTLALEGVEKTLRALEG